MADSALPGQRNEDGEKIQAEKEIVNNSDKDVKATEDTDLDDLLDSALEDFEKPVVQSPAVSQATQIADPGTVRQPVDPNAWSDEFIQQATAQFEDAMKNFLAEDETLGEEFRKMAEATGRAMTSHDSEQGIAESLSQTLKDLAENAEAISNPLTDEEISQLLGNIGLSQDIGTVDGSEPEDLLHIMKNVMQNLLSKELLYPALKDIVDKYPNWLATNRLVLEQSEYEKYNQQFLLMKQACDEFELEKEDDSDDIKRTRFEKVLDLMQKMQEYGHPPKELIGDMATGFELDEQGAPRLSGLPIPANGSDLCCLM